ncbi:MAG: hypothetical protein PHF24_08325 [Syntrophomonas sp.]|nr:hypothetical protein [Syntrophomonas sp.]
MSKDFLNNPFSNDALKEQVDLAVSKIKIGFSVITGLLLIILIVFFYSIMALD